MHWIIWTEANGVVFSGSRAGYTAEQLTWVLNHPSFRGYEVIVTPSRQLGEEAYRALMMQFDSLGRLV